MCDRWLNRHKCSDFNKRNNQRLKKGVPTERVYTDLYSERILPERKRALSTLNSSANRMWQKFFLLFLMAPIPPHCPKTSTMSCSVAFSGRPPTNTVLHPGGRSLITGGKRSVKHGEEKKTDTIIPIEGTTVVPTHQLVDQSISDDTTSVLKLYLIMKDIRIHQNISGLF